MTFAGLNYLAILIAAVAGFAVGAVWYTALSRPWQRLAAVPPGGCPRPGRGVGGVAHRHGLGAGRRRRAPRAGAGDAAQRDHLGRLPVDGPRAHHHGDLLRLRAAAGPPDAIDAGHWLAVLLVMGTVIGLLGV